jgi:hypothetical protein
VYSAYEIDDLLLPEDGLMIHHELTRDAESRNLIVRFLTVRGTSLLDSWRCAPLAISLHWYLCHL